MLTIVALLLITTAPQPAAPTSTAPTKIESSNSKCSTGRNRLRSEESREEWDKMKAMKKDGGGGVSKEAQAILDHMTEFYESEGDTDTAEMMREFAGGRAERRTAC